MRHRLTQRLRDSWARVVEYSLAEDLAHEFVDVVLPLLPEAAPEILAIVSRHTLHEAWLFMNHAPILYQHAREPFLARLAKPIRSPIRIDAALAKVAVAADPGEVPTLRALAERLVAQRAGERDPLDALEWVPVLSASERDAVLDAAVRHLTGGDASHIAYALRRFGSLFAPTHLHAIADAARARGTAATRLEALIALVPHVPANERERVAREAMETSHSIERTLIHDDLSIASGLVEHVPYALLQPWVDPFLASLNASEPVTGPDNERTLAIAAYRLARHVPAETLDLMLDRIESVGADLWQRLSILADVAPFHPTRRSALVAEIEAIITRVVILPQSGTPIAPEEIPDGADTVLLGLHAVIDALPVVPASSRTDLQRRLVATFASMRGDVERQRAVRFFPWSKLGAQLDPAFREPCVRALCAFEHRPTALLSIGSVVAEFPPEARHLALSALARLTDPVASAAVARTLDILRNVPLAPEATARTDRTHLALDANDRARLELFHSVALPNRRIDCRTIHGACEVLTPAAAEYVARSLDAYDRSDADDLARELIECPALAETTTRADLIARVIDRAANRIITSFDARRFADWTLTVCDRENASLWIDRVASLFDADGTEVESWLQRLEAFAPVIRLIGGDACVEEIARMLRDPTPVPAFAEPWRWAREQIGEWHTN